MAASSADAATSSAQRHNARLGLWLFFVYLTLYTSFVLLSAFAPAVMEWRPGDGINLALLYGFGLILAALALAFIYGWFAQVANADDVNKGQP